MSEYTDKIMKIFLNNKEHGTGGLKMADEYIKKSDVKNAMHSKYADDMRKYPEFVAWLKSAVNIVISEIPAADVQPVKRGHWIAENRDNRGYTDCYTCSHCESYVYTYTLMKDCEFDYCPNCGADMRGDENG